jgi:hypothetical protein
VGVPFITMVGVFSANDIFLSLFALDTKRKKNNIS